MDAVEALIRAVSNGGPSPGTRVLVAVSGGPDSVALLEALCRDAPSRQWSLAVCHVNHGLRAGASDEDEAFVRGLAEARDLPFFVVRVDTAKHARRCHQSIESSARNLRYSALRSTLSDWGGEVIALGHTEDDQAETVLLHLLRGSGTAGLAGMHLRSGDLWRPLLGIRHEDVLAALQTWRVGYRLDASNLDRKHLRNRIRRDILPEFERLQSRSVPAIARAARLIGQDATLLDSVAQEALGLLDVSIESNAVSASLGVWRALHPSLQGRVLRLIWVMLVGDIRDVDAAHAEILSHFLTSGSGRLASRLPRSVSARIEARRFVLSIHQPRAQTLPEVTVGVPGAVDTPVGRLTAEVLPADEDTGVWTAVAGRLHALCDADLAARRLTVRSRRPGDRVRPLHGRGSRKLQDILVDARVPRDLRNLVPVVEGEGTILWVPGFALDSERAIRRDTTRILHLRFDPAGFQDRAKMLGF